MTTRPVVVATDGTESSQAAADWAVREARRSHLPLRLVHVYEWDRHESQYDIGNENVDVPRKLAEAVVSAAVHRIGDLAPDVAVDAGALVGHPAARLLEVAESAELVVLGHRGRGGFAGLLLGSVSQRVATHAPCSVVVVRGRADEDGPVVVGVDDSPTAEHVLGTAFDAARIRYCALSVIRSYRPSIPLWLSDRPAGYVDTSEQDATEQVRLDAQLAPWRDKYPDVPVGTVLTHAGAAATLVAASRDAQLVVVGSRGRGIVRGALLGSTGMQLLHHAGCPVLITRPEV